jgi:signal transduction histidine kinase
MKRHALLRQYLLLFSAILLVNLGLASAITWQQSRSLLRDEWRYQLSEMAERVVNVYQRSQLNHLSNVNWTEQLNANSALTGLYLAAYEPATDRLVYDPLVGWSDRQAAGLIGDRATLVLAGERQFWLTSDQALLALSVRTAAGRLAILLLGLPRRADPALFLRLGRPILLVLLAVSLPTLLLAWLFLRRITRPLREMADLAEAVARGEYRPLTGPVKANELGDLGRALDGMSARLAAADQARRIYLSGLSHELRKPLTSIKLNIQGILDHVIPPQEEKACLEIAAAESERLRALIDNTIQSASDPAQWPQNRQNIDLGRLVRATARQMSLSCQDKRLRITVDGPESLLIDADDGQLRQVLINLLDNAGRFAPTGSAITISLARDAGRAIVSVTDQGPGIDPAILPRLFKEPIKRPGSPGSGLGLYLCQRLIDAHGGAIEAKRASDGGACIRFSLPIAAVAERPDLD